MPKISVRVPTQLDPSSAIAKVRPALAKTVTDFQGHDLQSTDTDNSTQFAFKSMAFTIKGAAVAQPGEVVVEVELPFAAIMFKDKAERAITKNVTRALEESSEK